MRADRALRRLVLTRAPRRLPLRADLARAEASADGGAGKCTATANAETSGTAQAIMRGRRLRARNGNQRRYCGSWQTMRHRFVPPRSSSRHRDGEQLLPAATADSERFSLSTK